LSLRHRVRTILGPTQPPIKSIPGFLTRVKNILGVEVTTHLNLVPRLRMCRAIPPRLQHASMPSYLVKHRANVILISNVITLNFPHLGPVDCSCQQTNLHIHADIVLGYGLDDQGSRVRFLAGAGTLSLTTASSTALGPTQPPIQLVPKDLSLGVKRLGREAGHSPPSSVKVKECVELYLNSPNIRLHSMVLS
jgi:hypothetical protein